MTSGQSLMQPWMAERGCHELSSFIHVDTFILPHSAYFFPAIPFISALQSLTWGSGPFLCMPCTSPIRFNWFLCTITEKFGVFTLVFLCCFQLPKQENFHKPFEWHSKINTAHTHTSLFTLSPYN